MEHLPNRYRRSDIKMKKINSIVIIVLFSIGAFGFVSDSFAQRIKDADSLVNYVKPLIGTDNGGNVYPGPTTPHGMVQLGPDTDMRNWSDGYDYGDSVIIGFSLQHLSGTGIPDLGDFAFTPSVGSMKFVPGMMEHKTTDGQTHYWFNPEFGLLPTVLS